MKLKQTSLGLILITSLGLASGAVLADSHGGQKSGDMKTMEEGMSKDKMMDDGMKKMDDGMKKMDDGMKKMDDGMKKMDDG